MDDLSLASPCPSGIYLFGRLVLPPFGVSLAPPALRQLAHLRFLNQR